MNLNHPGIIEALRLCPVEWKTSRKKYRLDRSGNGFDWVYLQAIGNGSWSSGFTLPGDFTAAALMEKVWREWLEEHAKWKLREIISGSTLPFALALARAIIAILGEKK